MTGRGWSGRASLAAAVSVGSEAGAAIAIRRFVTEYGNPPSVSAASMLTSPKITSAIATTRINTFSMRCPSRVAR